MKTRGTRIFTCTASNEKERRNLAILELVREKKSISRTDISKTTGVNVVSISNYVNSFLDNGLLLEKGFAESSGGRKPELIELNADGNHCIGIDARCDEISCALVDIAMKTIAKKKLPLADNSEVPPTAVRLVEDMVRSSGVPMKSVRAIGVGICCEKYLDVRDKLEKAFNIDTFAGGEAFCGAYAEKGLNPQFGHKNILYMHSDLGRGIFMSEDRCAGFSDEISGEDNRSAVSADETHDDKEKYLRPWSDYMSIVETAKREVLRGVGTKIVSLAGGDIGKVTESVVLEAARQKDETALNIVQGVAINLGLRISYLINLFGPEAVVFGGGMEDARDIAFPLIKKMVSRLSAKKYANTVKILPSSLGKDGLCMGAAALAVREVFLKA